MNPSNEADAFSAIFDVASKALVHEMPKEVSDALELIISLARYRQDIRAAGEKI